MSIYNKFDETVMKGVNAGVRAWNWTTGRTKVDLANSLLIGGVLTEAAFNLTANNVPRCLANLIVFGPTAYFGIKWFNKINDLEVSALAKNTKDLEVEDFKSIYSPYCAISSISHAPFVKLYNPSISNEDLEGAIVGSAQWSSSFYIMRADYLPPRKDCVRRGLDKLSEKLNEIEIPNPLLQPIPIPVNSNYSEVIV